METEIAIIGGGLSGLALARNLAEAGRDFQLFEARDRLGGRILSLDQAAQAATNPDSCGYDLGPSWFWPGQHRMATLVRELNLYRFDQYASGTVLFETETGEIRRDLGFASMQGAWRIQSGMRGLIDGLAQQLPQARLHLNHAATGLQEEGLISFANGQTCRAQQIVLALPPRLAAGLSFRPALSPDQMQALAGIPTWMGGQAKFVALYDQPFWRAAGLSGDAISRIGPLAEIHDACPPDAALDRGAPAALFGFVGLPPQARQQAQQQQNQNTVSNQTVTQAAVAQLQRLFGARAAHPVHIAYQDWAQERYTAAPLDHRPTGSHPAYGLPRALQNIWQGRLSFCVSELAPEMGGYLEGALALAQEQARRLQSEHAP